MQHGELARVGIELHLAEQRDFHPLGEHVGQVAAVEPFASQRGAGGVREPRFEQPETAPVEAGSLGRPHVRDDGSHFARSQLRDGLHVTAVLVAERHVGQQVLHGRQPLAFQHGRAGGADAFDIGERGSKIHAGRARNGV